MASSTAQIAKNKGNVSFKEGNWADAVGHYSAAVVADRTDPTYPLNRAAAYLKLGKHRDAERDCTTVLSLDARNIKALFRRAQARIALQNWPEAEKDLLEALNIEPANASIKAELATVQKLQPEASNKTSGKGEPISVPPSSPSQASNVSKPSTGTSFSHRITRKVPIEIVDSLEPATSDLLKPVHSRALSSPLIHSSPVASKSALKTQPRIGGGIFRPDGSHTIVRSPISETTSSPASASSPLSAPSRGSIARASGLSDATAKSNDSIYAPPPSHFAFTRAWNTLPAPQDRYSLISRIPPESLPVLFKDSLEPEFLMSMLRTFKAVASPSTCLNLSRFMCNLSSISRFNTVLLFLSSEEKRLVNAVWHAIDPTENNEGRHAWGL